MVDVEAIDSKVGQIGQTQNASGELDSPTELHTGIGYGLWFSDTVARSSRRRVADRFGSPTLRSAIESWAKQQDDKPPRSEAIRRLVEFALKAKSKRQSNRCEK
jgi:hypothetical protein